MREARTPNFSLYGKYVFWHHRCACIVVRWLRRYNRHFLGWLCSLSLPEAGNILHSVPRRPFLSSVRAATRTRNTGCWTARAVLAGCSGRAPKRRLRRARPRLAVRPESPRQRLPGGHVPGRGARSHGDVLPATGAAIPRQLRGL